MSGGLSILVEESIIARYFGELFPADTETIRELLTTLWGELVPVQTIGHVYERLIEYGAEEWPHACCAEDLKHEREQRLSAIDYQIEFAERHLAKLRKERDWLINAPINQRYAQEYRQFVD